MRLVSLVSCLPGPLGTWTTEDYRAYKIVRLIGGRRIAGSVWLPDGPGAGQRVSNAHREAALGWFVRRATPLLDGVRDSGRRVALVPFPDPGRVVGAPPSRSRALAQALADATSLRVLDVLRWRQPMPRCRALDLQTMADNLVTTGASLQLECVLVAECVWHGTGMQAAASRLRGYGATAHLAISAGRAGGPRETDPFTTMVQDLEDVVTADL